MKITEFRKLIREEIKKVLKETKPLTEAGKGNLYKFIVGTPTDDGLYRDDIEDGYAKMPQKLQDEWDDIIDYMRGDAPSDHIPELEFYVKNKKYFSQRLVKMSQDILKSGELEK